MHSSSYTETQWFSAPVRTTDLIHPAGQSSDIIISVPSPEHRVDASRNVIIGLDAFYSRRECVPSANRELWRAVLTFCFRSGADASVPNFGKTEGSVELALLSGDMFSAERGVNKRGILNVQTIVIMYRHYESN